MVKLTLKETRIAMVGLNAILGIDLPARPSYWLARYQDKISSEMKAIETARIQILNKYVKKDKEGKPLRKKDKDGKLLNQYDFSDANKAKFEEEFDKFLDNETEISYEPIKLADLDAEVCEKCGRPKLRIKPIILAQLGKIVVV